jgi:hypothetical protein
MSIAVLSRHCSLNANQPVFQLKYRQSGMIFLTDKYTAFMQKYMSACDGRSTERIIDSALGKERF